MALCFALATAASMWLERRSGRRAAAWGAARGIRSRADVILPDPGYMTAVTGEPVRPAITGPAIMNFNFYGADATQAAVGVA